MSTREYARIPNTEPGQATEGEAGSREVTEGESAADEYTVNLGNDVYDAVIVASFQGVKLKDYDATSAADEDDSTGGVFVPPIAMLLLVALPVFYLQVTVIWCLFLDSDLKESVITPATLAEDPHNALVLSCQVLMVMVLANTLLKEFVVATEGLAIILNPRMWQCLKKPAVDGPYKLFFHSGLSFFCCLIAKAGQIYVIYNTIFVSVSVILGETNCVEVVFDSLAATFIVEMHSKILEIVGQVFHLDLEAYEEDSSTFKVKPGYDDALGDRGFVHMLTVFASFFMLEVVYVKQILVFHKAHRTGIMPVARDVCLYYRGLIGQSPEGRMRAQLTEWGTAYIDFKKQIKYMVLRDSDLPKTGPRSIVCEREEYDLQEYKWEAVMEFKRILQDDPLHSKAFWLLIAVTFCLVFYQIMFALASKGKYKAEADAKKAKPKLRRGATQHTNEPKGHLQALHEHAHRHLGHMKDLFGGTGASVTQPHHHHHEHHHHEAGAT